MRTAKAIVCALSFATLFGVSAVPAAPPEQFSPLVPPRPYYNLACQAFCIQGGECPIVLSNVGASGSYWNPHHYGPLVPGFQGTVPAGTQISWTLPAHPNGISGVATVGRGGLGVGQQMTLGTVVGNWSCIPTVVQ